MGLFFALTFYTNLFACQCSSSQSFDLSEYDFSENILLIEVLGKSDDKYSEYVKWHKEEALQWNKSFPQLPLMPRPPHDDFSIRITNVFKGELSLGILKLRSENSSCKWSPMIGQTYIIYLESLKREGKINYLNVSACHRKIREESNNFKSELEVLNYLKEKVGGPFEFRYSINYQGDSLSYKFLSGRFDNQNREGQWIMSEPVPYEKIRWKLVDTMIVLGYKSDKLIETNFNYPSDDSIQTNVGGIKWKWIYLFYTDKMRE